MSKEKDPLLSTEEESPEYSEIQSQETKKAETSGPPGWYEGSPGCLKWLYDHRERIPGYGVYKLLRKVSYCITTCSCVLIN